MELLVLAMLGYGLYAAGAHVRRRYQDHRATIEHRERAAADANLQADLRRAKAYAAQRRLRRLNHLMQTALLQLEQAPDFRRAASFAILAKDVPIAFRQRQFRRFRGRFLAHLLARLRAGGNAADLRQSLEDLVTALGLASFEANYLWQEAEQQLERRRPSESPSFASSVATLEQDHQQRVQVLQETPGVEAELREQLLEAEEHRFREALLALNEQASAPS
ncbi:MAG: hypothetical protein AB7U73_01415 [Pirellulales bacterium]